MGLLVNQNVDGQKFLVVGSGALVERRAATLRVAGAEATVLQEASKDDITSRGRPEVDGVVDGVFVVSSDSESLAKAQELAKVCARLRVPINVAEHPELCTFTLPSTYKDGPFQLAVTTGGKGCRLASRIRRTAVNALPNNLGAICNNVGKLRADVSSTGDNDDDVDQSTQLNTLVTDSTPHSRARWLSQMVEYFPLDRLASVTLEDLEQIAPNAPSAPASPGCNSKGKISLVGAGPGSAGLLTAEALREITAADYVLADKLVPEEVLALIPRHTPVFIARKFPGNAERAQEELLEKGLAALELNQHVVRLKQGDPYVYGRGAEEYLFFEKHGYIPHVVPGVTSALAAPLLAKISPTHRGAADQILICTGTGRAGALLEAPEWVPSRTTIFLMALHRIGDVVKTLIARGWDPNVPCATIERASCPDQRVVRTTLKDVAEALEAVGSRPPGLLVVGRSCTVLTDPSEKWVVEEGLEH